MVRKFKNCKIAKGKWLCISRLGVKIPLKKFSCLFDFQLLKHGGYIRYMYFFTFLASVKHE